MAEAEQSDKTTPTPHRRPHYQGRPGPSYRGRGRANASVSKALHLFGVRDLREILDRKHHDEEQSHSGPPPDPSYSYLKDPSRENAYEPQNQRYNKERSSNDAHPRGHYFRGSRGRGRGTYRDNRQHEPEKAFIQNPVNIKVELIASTGERNCQVDGETKIPDIKHIPNYQLKDLRPRNEGVAGKDFNDKHRNEDVAGKDNNTYRNERGRGRGQRGRRGRGRGDRGRGGRGRGRGQYRHPNKEVEKTTEGEISQENLDEQCIDVPTEGPDRKENEDNHEEEYVESQEHESEDQEEYYEGEAEYLEANEQAQSLDEAAGETEIKLEENLVITSSDNDEKRKRTVTFKLDEKEGKEAEQQDLKNEKSVDKDLPEKEEN